MTLSGSVAHERLKIILDAEKKRLDDETMQQMQQEIATVVTRYIDVEPDNIEVKVRLKGV